jgi:hypothetical protein
MSHGKIILTGDESRAARRQTTSETHSMLVGKFRGSD